MKLMMKPIEMIAWFTMEGVPIPLKFRVRENEEWRTIKVDDVCHKDYKYSEGIHIHTFICQSLLNGMLRKYEVVYEHETCKWILHKM